MEEAWLLRFPGDDSSVHLQIFPASPQDWSDPALIEKWNRIRQLRRVVTGALEIERAAKRIGSSLEAAPTLYVSNPADFELLNSVPFAEIAITSTFEVKLGNASGTGSDSSDADSLQISGQGNAQRLIWPSDAFELMGVDGAAALVEPAPGHKCARCWMVLPEVGKNPKHDDLCNRCAGAIEGASP
jgi:isoleucyl-tRNA synthetase